MSTERSLSAAPLALADSRHATSQSQGCALYILLKLDTMLIEKLRFVLPATAISIVGFGYFLTGFLRNDPRFGDRRLEVWESAYWEDALLGIALLCAVTLWFSAVRHARKGGRKRLELLLLMVWPSALVYGLMIACKRSSGGKT